MSQHLRKELPNNFLKITKWGVQSYLAGVETIKIGFVTRKNTKSNASHLIVGFYDIRQKDLLNVTNFNRQTSWGIFKHFIDLVRNQPDGTFILMKTLAGPKPMVKLVKLPPNTNLDNEEDEF